MSSGRIEQTEEEGPNRRPRIRREPERMLLGWPHPGNYIENMFEMSNVHFQERGDIQ